MKQLDINIICKEIQKYNNKMRKKACINHELFIRISSACNIMILSHVILCMAKQLMNNMQNHHFIKFDLKITVVVISYDVTAI